MNDDYYFLKGFNHASIIAEYRPDLLHDVWSSMYKNTEAPYWQGFSQGIKRINELNNEKGKRKDKGKDRGDGLEK